MRRERLHLLFAEQTPVGEARQDASHDRCNPEKPGLRECPTADENRLTRASCRIHRGVRDRNADQVDQREPETTNDMESADQRRLSFFPRLRARDYLSPERFFGDFLLSMDISCCAAGGAETAWSIMI